MYALLSFQYFKTCQFHLTYFIFNEFSFHSVKSKQFRFFFVYRTHSYKDILSFVHSSYRCGFIPWTVSSNISKCYTYLSLSYIIQLLAFKYLSILISYIILHFRFSSKIWRPVYAIHDNCTGLL